MHALGVSNCCSGSLGERLDASVLRRERVRPLGRRGVSSKLVFFALFCLATYLASTRSYAQDSFVVSAPGLHDGGMVSPQQLYDRGGCHGANISPALNWQHAPAGTKSFAVTVFDPDAPGRGWWHWAVANIPASIHALPANASASGALAALGAIQARNDFDDEGYSGPCPPPGAVHHYDITVYALKDAALPVVAGRPALFFEHEILDAVLAKARMRLSFQRAPGAGVK
ncbi:MAG: YbhB/YbcL family Raf kinase inhibitor-like protein [Janthinobacterium lividum]